MISFILGTTAELIKIAPVYHAIVNRGTKPKIWFTAQHVDEVSEVLADLQLPEPDAWLVPRSKARNLETPSQVPGWALTVARNAWARRAELRAILAEDGRPPLVIVHGDTFTTPGGALIAKRFLGARVAHVEAGCRSGSLLSPLPEEINRKVAAKLVDLHFAPSAREAHNLRNARGAVIDTGANTAIDALRMAVNGTFPDLDLPAEYGLATLHRFELVSRADKYREALEALRDHSAKLPILYMAGAPERERIERLGLGNLFDSKRFIIQPKMRYLQFLPLMARAKFVVTDSGGLGAECFYLGLPCAIHRERTESPQHIGETVVLTGMQKDKLADFLATYQNRRGPSLVDQYQPSEIIVDTLAQLGHC
ncbi:UDP-N-acetylglucosamine 2-epimerase [Actinokineospora globicatena]|uniref:UDP-N-acetyl glucosamine 2-epimerase n=1 Tax=Actinokineospora globicatena TaxID=103729 RepID=A0A9W6QK80_9PSEU|nr:UDP-N-acetylglucosamine 2-epimerase [Actinokineospora globicatena]MCP2301115.1 UDP-N-acetylglucosamine 2-epimerase (non-hydrolyzing) [Actinokineospora globicatena]GLW77249.1 UDP-N-acetyl glucosamine 2-epimerase [Actinokineospora globicatena]GLW84083.1 UDP-N-acetyl glucosamine 2-epimerase [Actinokineospora globicatena]GLW91973.1 UDP-N-acetyl glucosamine 2-epimerase [Actinokineospora globicatena]